MSAEHTPGPWRVRYFPTERHPYVTDSIPDAANGRFMGQVIAGQTTCPDWKSNARLIAAAPELLAACEALLADAELLVTEENCSAIEICHSGAVEAVIAARSAIAKATGKATA